MEDRYGQTPDATSAPDQNVDPQGDQVPETQSDGTEGTDDDTRVDSEPERSEEQVEDEEPVETRSRDRFGW